MPRTAKSASISGISCETRAWQRLHEVLLAVL